MSATRDVGTKVGSALPVLGVRWMTASKTKLEGRPGVTIIGASAGNMIEWYDWFVYSTFMPYFADVFFPSADRKAAFISTAAVLAMGYQIRPIGAWLMGAYADREGRKAALKLSMSLMCMTSVVIAVLPGYRTIGIIAPFLLVCSRLLQGAAIGGEFGTSGVYLSEVATPGRRGLYCSFQYVALVSGQFFASFVLLALQRLLTIGQLSDWGWRAAFAIEGVFALAILCIRRRLPETRSFESVKAGRDQRSGLLVLFGHHAKAAFAVGALTAGGTLAFYAYATYLPGFLVDTGFARETATHITAGALLVFMLCQPVAGMLSDRFGSTPLMIGFGALGLLFTCVIFWLIAAAGSAYAVFGLASAGLLIATGYTAVNALVKAEMFPAHIRCLGVALSGSLANTIFGGTAQSVARHFREEGNEGWFIWYITAVIGIALVAYVGMRGPRRHRLSY